MLRLFPLIHIPRLINPPTIWWQISSICVTKRQVYYQLSEILAELDHSWRKHKMISFMGKKKQGCLFLSNSKNGKEAWNDWKGLEELELFIYLLKWAIAQPQAAVFLGTWEEESSWLSQLIIHLLMKYLLPASHFHPALYLVSLWAWSRSGLPIGESGLGSSSLCSLLSCLSSPSSTKIVIDFSFKKIYSNIYNTVK